MRSKEELIEYLDKGNRAKYIFFWGHTSKGDGITKTCFSQWYPSPFQRDGIVYPTAEHFMMAEKARLFGDEVALPKILAAKNPGHAKALGRSVLGFDERLWLERRFDIVIDGNFLKFSQDPELKNFLLGTGQRVIVEASPVDKVWGIGCVADNPAAEQPQKWKGLNLLGFALMEVRARLSE